MSALADGELNTEAVTVALQGCCHEEAALASWNAYHLIGEVLRLPNQHAPVGNLDFLFRLNKRLSQEKIITSLVEPITINALDALDALDAMVQIEKKSVPDLIRHPNNASNDSHVRWKLVASLASLTAIIAMGSNAFGLLTPEIESQFAQVKTKQEQVLVVAPSGMGMHETRLEKLLSEHKQVNGTAVLQRPSGFLQNIFFEVPQDMRP